MYKYLSVMLCAFFSAMQAITMQPPSELIVQEEKMEECHLDMACIAPDESRNVSVLYNCAFEESESIAVACFDDTTGQWQKKSLQTEANTSYIPESIYWDKNRSCLFAAWKAYTNNNNKKLFQYATYTPGTDWLPVATVDGEGWDEVHKIGDDVVMVGDLSGRLQALTLSNTSNPGTPKLLSPYLTTCVHVIRSLQGDCLLVIGRRYNDNTLQGYWYQNGAWSPAETIRSGKAGYATILTARVDSIGQAVLIIDEDGPTDKDSAHNIYIAKKQGKEWVVSDSLTINGDDIVAGCIDGQENAIIGWANEKKEIQVAYKPQNQSWTMLPIPEKISKTKLNDLRFISDKEGNIVLLLAQGVDANKFYGTVWSPVAHSWSSTTFLTGPIPSNRFLDGILIGNRQGLVLWSNATKTDQEALFMSEINY